MTILEALTWAEERFRASFEPGGNHHPKIDAQVLLAEARGKQTSYLFIHIDEQLNAQTEHTFRQWVQRRANHEPVAYIIGKKGFYGRTFMVNSHTLIPRPETELLVDQALLRHTPNTLYIDVGTGSGAIAVTLAAEKKLAVLATDASPQAVSVAKYNAHKHGVEKIVSVQEGNLLEPIIRSGATFHDADQAVICANLPYLTINQWKSLDPDVKTFEPKLALVGGVDGLDLYEELLDQVSTHRSIFPPAITFLFEIDPMQARGITSLAKEHELTCSILKDLRTKERIAILASR